MARRRWPGVVGLALAACSAGPGEGATGPAEGPRERASLIRADAWAPAEGADDPLAEHRPDGASCPVSAATVEAGGFEIQTELCSYASFSQPSLVDVRPGDQLVISAFHSELSALEPATAHFAVLLDGAILWEQTVDIPAYPEFAAARPYTVTVDASAEAPVGAPVVVHLHNHGANQWRLVVVDRIPAEGS
ncbi:MAG: hypothetical protein KC636_03460 [Myxococcales bacterium]|nr:hypothetical protein [Myxococcales bacterium]